MTTTKKTVALLSTSALAAGAAHGAVLYTNVNITLSEHGALSLDLNQDGTPDFQLAFNATAAAKPYITNAPAHANDASRPLRDLNPGFAGHDRAARRLMAAMKPPSRWDILTKTMPSTPAVVGSWTAAGNVEGYVGLKLTDGAGIALRLGAFDLQCHRRAGQ